MSLQRVPDYQARQGGITYYAPLLCYPAPKLCSSDTQPVSGILKGHMLNIPGQP